MTALLKYLNMFPNFVLFLQSLRMYVHVSFHDATKKYVNTNLLFLYIEHPVILKSFLII